MVWPRPEGEPPPKIKREKLREIIEVVDDVPPLPRVSLDFADWVARLHALLARHGAAHDDERRPRLRSSGAALWRAARGAAPDAHDAGARPRARSRRSNGLIWIKSSLAEAAGVSPGVIDGLVDAGTLITEPLPDWHAMPLDLSRQRAKLTEEQAQRPRDAARQYQRRLHA